MKMPTWLYMGTGSIVTGINWCKFYMNASSLADPTDPISLVSLCAQFVIVFSLHWVHIYPLLQKI